MTHRRIISAAICVCILDGLLLYSAPAVGQIIVGGNGIRIQIGEAPPPPPMPVGVVVLTRGPIHEAFAQPITFTEEAAFTINRQPPPPLDEYPPELKPEGNHVLWIPGYWSWDTDRVDFTWVSGCWRAVPPGASWVPGYWAQSSRGFEWMEGFWTTSDTDEIEYLSAPPVTLEVGPQGAGPPDSIWIPGTWVPFQGRYAWRPGFWEQAQVNWVWTPAQFVFTPRGWIYVDGYWDYPLDRRGVAFLPVYVPSVIYTRADYRYSPDYAMNLDDLTINLFISPGRHQYFFGDYYGVQYVQAGYYPWYEVQQRHDWYDPIFIHEQWRHRDDRQWTDRQRQVYVQRRDNVALRPATTYDAMQVQVARLPEKDRVQATVAQPIKAVVAAKTTPFKFDSLDAKTRDATATQAKEVHAYQEKRSQWEAPAAARAASVPKVVAPAVVAPPKETTTPRGPASVPPRETPKPPVAEPPKPPVTELPKPPAPDSVPRGRAPAGDRAIIADDALPPKDILSEKVKIPKSPTAARGPSADKTLTPPSKPNQPKPDPSAQPRGGRGNGPDPSKDRGPPDKPDSKNP